MTRLLAVATVRSYHNRLTSPQVSRQSDLAYGVMLLTSGSCAIERAGECAFGAGTERPRAMHSWSAKSGLVASGLTWRPSPWQRRHDKFRCCIMREDTKLPPSPGA